MQALLIRCTTFLTQLARDAPRAAAARVGRQYLARWLETPQWAPDVVYAGLTRELTRVLGRQRRVAHAPRAAQAAMLATACACLRADLPGPPARYVLMLDRGFPSHTLIRTLQAADWRFVVWVNGSWKLTHPQGRGTLQSVLAPARSAGQPPQWYWAAVLGAGVKARGSGASPTRWATLAPASRRPGSWSPPTRRTLWGSTGSGCRSKPSSGT